MFRELSQSPRPRPRRAWLTVEGLEERHLLSGFSHVLYDPVNGQPFIWQGQLPGDRGHVDLFYDFRARNGFANLITPPEQALAVQALDLWSAASNGVLRFTRNTAAPLAQIMNIGMGDLGAVGDVSVPGGIVGEGGDDLHFTTGVGRNVLEGGYAWLDSAETYDEQLGNGTPALTVEFFTVVAHEIGHALGLGHTDDLPGPSIMDSRRANEQTMPSASETALIQSLYSAAAAAAPPPLVATGSDAGAAPEVRVFNGTSLVLDFNAYDPGFTGGVRVAMADLDADGNAEIITAPGPGGGPDIRVFDAQTGALLRRFVAFDGKFTGGVFVAAGDINGDGVADVICGADRGGGPNVVVYSGKDGRVLQSFFAFDLAFTGGVRVAAGDLDGDHHAEIVAGAGPGGGPNVTVFRSDGSAQSSFFAYNAAFTGGVFVAAGDVNGDGRTEIITGAGVGGGPDVGLFDGRDGTRLDSFFSFDAAFTGGVRVGVLPVGLGPARVLAAAGPGAAPQVLLVVAGAPHAPLETFYAYPAAYAGGVFIGAAD